MLAIHEELQRVSEPKEHAAPDEVVVEEPTDRGAPSPARAAPSTLLPSRRRTFLMGDTMVDVEAPTELQRSTLVAGEYEIVRRIARCDLGVLYEVTRRSNGRPCTLKALERAASRGAAERAHFTREARVASRIESPHCPAVIAAGSDPTADVLWIALERLVGETLAERLTRLGVGVPMEVADALEVVSQLGRGLACAHDVGVVHGDLKPANVFLATGEPFTVKLLDFSAAHAVDEPDAVDGPLGTPLWMSPEQATGNAVSRATDVWSVGLLAFRMLTGRSYWLGARNAVVEMKNFLDELLESPLQGASERARAVGCERALPEGFDVWFSRCVSRDPRRRFRNADEMTLALRDVGARPSTAPLPPRLSEAPATASTPPRRERGDATRSSPAVAAVSQPAQPSVSQAPPAPQGPPVSHVPPPVTQAPPVSHVPPPSLDNPMSFAFFNEEKTRAIPRPPVVRPWRLLALGFALGVTLVAGTFALLHVGDDDDGSLSVAAAVNDPRRDLATISSPQPAAPPPVERTTAHPLAAPSPTADSGAVAVSWGDAPRRVWQGTVTGDDGEWAFVLTLTRAETDTVRGYFAWTAVRAADARDGEQVRESVEGTWRAATGELLLRGVTSTASDVLPVNGYRARISPGGTLDGTTLDERGHLSGTASTRRRRGRREE